MSRTQSRAKRHPIAANLREARVKAGFESVSDAARFIGIPVPSAVAHEGAGKSFRKPKLEMLRLYAEAYHTTIDALEFGSSTTAEVTRTVNKTKTRDLPEIVNLVACPVLGTAQAGNWVEADPISEHAAEHVPVKKGPTPVFAVNVSGDSMNRILHDGDIAIIRPWSAMKSDPVGGDILLVQRENAGKYEASIKVFRDGKLWADSVNPRWLNKSLPLTNGDTVTIVGKVVGIYRAV